MSNRASSAVSEQCAIILLDRGPKRIPFQFAPSSLRDGKGVDYTDIPIIGRSSPFKSYKMNPSRQISFTINYHAHPEVETPFSIDQVKNTINTLLSLPYPDYSSFVIKPPTKCLLVIGNLLKNFKCVCKHVSPSYRDDIPWDLDAVLPFGVSISLLFEECVNSPLSYSDIANGQFADSSNAGDAENAAEIGYKNLPTSKTYS